MTKPKADEPKHEPKRDEQPETLDDARKTEGAVPAAPLTKPALHGDETAPGFGQSGNVVNAPPPDVSIPHGAVGVIPGTIVQAPPPPLTGPAPEHLPAADTVNDHGERKRVVDAGGAKHIEGTHVVVGGPTQQ